MAEEPNVYISDRERTQLVERYNALNRTIMRQPDGTVSLKRAMEGMMEIIGEQQQVLSLVVDVLGNTTRRNK